MEPQLVEVASEDELPAALAEAGLTSHQPVLVVVGGASGLTGEAESLSRRVVREVTVPVAFDHGAVIVDGGTDSGIIRIVGRAHGGEQGRPPLVGVAVRRLVRTRDQSVPQLADAAAAEPHHTHLVLVPGERWGDESRWLSAVAACLAGDNRTATMVLNGGEITLSDVAYSVAAGRPVLAVAGTGRIAELLVAAAQHGSTELADGSGWAADAVAHAVGSGLLSILDPARPVEVQRQQLSRLLSPR